jgi:hypothetical protein
MASPPQEEFISEQIVPVPGTASTAGMARGEPGLPARFTWRGRQYRVVRVMQTWKTSGPCRSGADEIYLRRHWYKIRTDPDAVMTLYFERQAVHPRRPKARWWIYSLQRGAADQPTGGQANPQSENHGG